MLPLCQRLAPKSIHKRGLSEQINCFLFKGRGNGVLCGCTWGHHAGLDTAQPGALSRPVSLAVSVQLAGIEDAAGRDTRMDSLLRIPEQAELGLSRDPWLLYGFLLCLGWEWAGI